MKKKWIIALIICFPSLFWIILESSTINSKKLPFYGPKSVINEDTVYYKVPKAFYDIVRKATFSYPGSYISVFIDESYRKDSYRLDGLWEYFNYNFEKIKELPFIFIFENTTRITELKTFLKQPNFYFTNCTNFTATQKAYYLKKPYYVDSSYFVLVDHNQHIRGYYDARYIAEVKRLIGEYQHLRIKEEKQLLIEKNEIKQNP